MATTGARAAGKSTGTRSTAVTPSSSAATGARTAGGGSGAGGRALTLASVGGKGAENGVTGASSFTRTAPAGSSRLSTTLGCGAGGGTDTSLGAGARGGAATWLRMMRVRPFFPSSEKKPGYAGSCLPAGGTGGMAAAAGAVAGSAGGGAEKTGLGGLGAGGDTGFAGGAAATALADGAADMGLAGGAAADDVSCWGSDFIAAAGLGNPAGMAKLGGAARPTMVLPNVGLSRGFPVMGQVRVSGRCCLWQWGQGFTANLGE